MRILVRHLAPALPCLLALACGGAPPSTGTGGAGPARAAAATDMPLSGGWQPLFNGQDLEGWIPKIRGQAAGEDPMGTFRVVPDPEGWDGGRHGLLVVSYDGYTGDFRDRFGHLFYRAPLSEYDLLVEYRFVGSQAPGGPAWARRNSGVMLHAQAPETMGLDQDFPVSVEAQFLGGLGSEPRPTGNVCTPGTEVRIRGERAATHCVNAAGPTIPGDRWVTLVLRVRGDREIVHFLDGEEILRYTDLEVGGGAVSGHDPARKVDGAPLTGGYIALQSESHPVQFRRVWIRRVGAGGSRAPGLTGTSSSAPSPGPPTPPSG